MIIILLLAIILYIVRKRVFAYVLFFFFITQGFKFLPPEVFYLFGGLINKGLDYALIFLLIILFIERQNIIPFVKEDKVAKLILIFLLYLTLLNIFNFFINNDTLKEIIRTSRQFYLLLIYFPFRLLRYDEVNKIFDILFRIVTIQCMVYIVQFFTKQQLMYGSEYKGYVISSSEEYIRFYNNPDYLVFFFYYLLFSRFFSGVKKAVYLSIYIMNIILPLARFFIFVNLLIASTMYLYINNKFRLMKLVFIILLFFGVFSNPLIEDRIESGSTFEDIQLILSGNYYAYTSGNYTFSFRIAHLMERWNYLINSPINLLFGVGMVTEDSPRINRFNFLIGPYNPEENRIYLLDMGDIAWSPLLLRLGMIGTLMICLLYFKILLDFKKNLTDRLAVVGFTNVLFLFLNSFMTNAFYLTISWLPIFLLYSTIVNSSFSGIKEK